MDIFELAREYGWLAVVTAWLAPRVWQFLTEHFFPQRVAEREREQAHRISEKQKEQEMRDEALQAERDARATLIKAQIEREEREFTHRQQMDNRVAAALEGMSTAIQQMSLAATVGNERITQLISAHSQHHSFVFGSHVELKEKLEQLQETMDVKKKVEELSAELHDTKRKMKAVAPEKKAGDK